MATDATYIDFLRDQLRGAPGVTFKKMFGEYAMYVDDKVVALVCDDQVFVKPTEAGRVLLGRVEEGAPYPGAKPHLAVSDRVEEPGVLAELIAVTAAALPAAKAKKPKKKTPSAARHR
jgi:DNA transformation protein and related proteins